MIYIINEGKKLTYSIDKYSQILTKAKMISDNALMHFFDLIGLDHSLFEHLKDVKLVIDLDIANDFEEMLAFYENIWEEDHSIDNAIHFLPEYLDSCIKDEKKFNTISDLVKTIIHETIHSNRSVIVNNSILYNNLLYLSRIREYESYVDTFSSFNLNGDQKYKVLKCIILKHFYIVTAYNTINGDFNVFSLSHKIKFNDLNELEKLLNKNIKLFGNISIVENPYVINPTALISEYSLSDSNICKLNKKGKINNENAIIESLINKQNGFEECITEAFSRIVFYLKDKNEFNFDKLLEMDKLTPDVKLGLNLIKKLDMDTIRWFFLSCYMDEYENKFYKLFEKDYYRLIDRFNQAYDCTMSNEDFKDFEESLELIRNLKKITIN